MSDAAACLLIGGGFVALTALVLFVAWAISAPRPCNRHVWAFRFCGVDGAKKFTDRVERVCQVCLFRETVSYEEMFGA